jgi:hypothetical protein
MRHPSWYIVGIVIKIIIIIIIIIIRYATWFMYCNYIRYYDEGKHMD